MEDTYVIDTNFISTIMDNHDPNNKWAISTINTIGRTHHRFIIPFIVVAELLAGNTDNDFIEICKVFSKSFPKNTEKDLIFIKSIDPAKRASLKANDLLILAIKKRFNAKLLTYDKKLLKLSEKI